MWTASRAAAIDPDQDVFDDRVNALIVVRLLETADVFRRSAPDKHASWAVRLACTLEWSRIQLDRSLPGHRRRERRRIIARLLRTRVLLHIRAMTLDGRPTLLDLVVAPAFNECHLEPLSRASREMDRAVLSILNRTQVATAEQLSASYFRNVALASLPTPMYILTARWLRRSGS